MRRRSLPSLVPLAVLVSAWLSCRDVPPASAGSPDPRLPLPELRTRQSFAAEHSVLYPHAGGDPYPRAARKLVRGEPVAIGDLPVDYWRWPLVLYLWRQGQPAAEEWLEAWLSRERTEWRHRSMYGSLNHQLARNGGLYAAVLVLGSERARAHGDASVANARERIADIITGRRWWDSQGVWPHPIGASAGRHPETTRSRHYAMRNWTYLWAIADCGEDEEARLAVTELDIACGILRQGVRPDGLWDETLLPRYRPEKDALFFPETWRSFGLTCHPSQTPVISYILFDAVPWRPEFQGHWDRKLKWDERHEQWSDYLLVGGRRWRPPSSETN